MSDTSNDHEIVSIYGMNEAQIDRLMTQASECVLMWSTKDGWPVGVTHAFLWKDGKVWLTFAAHRHRAAAIRRDMRGELAENEKTPRLESDSVRMNRERAKRGLAPR